VTTYRHSPFVLQRKVGTQVLVTIPGDQSVHRLSGSAGVTWWLLESSMTVEQLVAEVASIYDMEPLEVSPEVEALVRDLADRGWLDTTPAQDG
jgi:Coenzyme PQQ synthesis protein D (PqqD)